MDPARQHAAEVDAAIADARRGMPSLLIIDGPPGSGKTTLLQEVCRRSDDFAWLPAEGSEQDLDPFSTLSKSGVVIPPTAAPVVAAQVVRERLSEGPKQRPVLLSIDDAHWSDRDSITAVAHLLERSQHGDQLLIAITTHEELPTARERLEGAATGTLRQIRLAGFTLDEARQFVIESGQALPDQVVVRIWRSTLGNALHFTSIVRNYEPDELNALSFLPAPEVFSRSVNRRLERMGPDAAGLLRASAILGTEWKPLAQVAAVAGVQDPVPAVESLLQAGLISHHPSGETLGAIRPVHGLVRAAVYQTIGFTARSDLHRAAALVVSDPEEVLVHRAAASWEFDVGLADDLELAARRVHDIGGFRRAAGLLYRASELSPDPSARQRLRLDAVYEEALAGDIADPFDAIVGLYDNGDGRVPLVAATLAVQENRWTEAMRLLDPVIDSPLESTDPLVRYRCEVLAAWAGNGVGMDAAWLSERFDHARCTGVNDPIMHGYFTLTELQIRGRELDMAGYLDFAAWLPRSAPAVPIELSYELMSRGIAHAVAGNAVKAKADLAEMERRFQLGFMNLGDGVTHGFLGLAHWLCGEQGLSEVKFGTARDMLRTSANPVASSLCVVGLVAAGRLEEADSLLASTRERLKREPWWEAVRIYTVALGVRLHASADEDARAVALDELEADFGEAARDLGSPAYPIWLVPRGWLAIWAERLDEAEGLAHRLGMPSIGAAWAGGAAHWLRGLVAERKGDRMRAQREITNALSSGFYDVQIFAAHCLADRARVTGSSADRDEAVARYQELRQTPYVDRLLPGTATNPDSRREELLEALSDRERDVLTLIVSGLSYSQVARDLFVSKPRSTDESGC